MTIAKPNYSLSAESAKAILEAARPTAPPSAEAIERVRRWLEDGLERAICRVRAKPLTQDDVRKLKRAYVRFCYIVQALQDRRHPPPLLPVSAGQTEWDYWLTTHQALRAKRGPKETVDWHFIGELIALYEVTSKRRASASQAGGPTMHYLETALHNIQNSLPEDVRSYFEPPGAGVVKKNLGVLRKGYFRFLRDELEVNLGMGH